MRLKKLEVKGFKSFAKQTVIHFSENVTGVVGPNGSGKSNVVDAIRWVLGEQRSKDLRLEKMSDVLFNGTKKRKKAGMAQVTITFDNNSGILPLEYNEVAISRVLYRSGQSEYRLNNVTCRLKDIKNLLANTGIGSNSYAIIELGMVDDILQDKNNARRRMFEQAAGIHGFKQRKHETSLKLKATNDDLDRVNDLLHEILANMKQLEKQARRAKRYLKLKDEYKRSSILLSALNLSTFKERYAELKDQIQQNQASQTELYAKINNQTAAIERQKLDIQKSEGSLTEMQKKVRSVEHDVADLQRKISVLDNQIKYDEQDLIKEKNQAESNSDRIRAFENQQAELKVAIDAAEADIEIKRNETEDALQKRDELASKMRNVEVVKNELLQKQQDLNAEITGLERTLAVELNRQQVTDQAEQHTQHEAVQKQEKLVDLRQQRDEFKKNLDKQVDQVRQLERQYAEDQLNYDALKVEIEQKTEQIIECQRSLDARNNEYELLKNMIENLEGYPDSIKFLAKEHSWRRDVALLSEIINCDDKVKNAIEAVLEPYLNFYVVQGKEEAASAITLLKDAQKGRAAFFDAAAFTEVNSPEPIEIPGFFPALLAIELPDQYRGLIISLLGQVYIHDGVSNFDSSTAAPDHVTLVAHDGHRIQSQNRLSGGSPGLFDGLKIGRKKNLEKIQSDMLALKKQIEVLVLSKTELLDRQENIDLFKIQQQLDEKRSMLATYESEFKNLNVRQDEIEHQIAADKERLLHLRQQKTDSERVSATAVETIQQLKINYEALIAELSGESSIIDRLASELNSFNELHSQKNIALVQAESHLSNLNNEVNMITGRISELTEEVEAIVLKDESLSQKIEDNKLKFENLQRALQETLKRKTNTGEELSTTEQDYFQYKNQLAEAESLLGELNRQNRDKQYLITSLKDEYNEIKIKLNDVTQRVKVEFNISTPELMEVEIPEDIQSDALTTNVERMRMKIYGFGEVNPLAVEAFNEMKERYDGIALQKQDIEDAQRSLLDTIKELEQQATIQFMEALEKINIHFKQIFRSLFNAEDNCELILLDPDNPLESKIEVIAKPKGKRPQSLSQLSGGEKTLTATALLFALYLLKPAPFCIFDEVDAPLDDSNIQKFNNIIQTFSGDSQFVIITHNKLTMAAVDVIYGVYMDEPGVSGVTPVDFRELKHEMLPLELSEN